MRPLLLLALLAASSATAQEAPAPDAFNALFASTCMQHFHSPDKLRASMQREGIEPLTGDQAEFFLGGKPGSAWLLLTSGTRYVVSLRDDSVCAVFAQQADQASTQAGFVALVQNAPDPIEARVADATDLGPEGDDTRTIAYTWSRAADPSELLFVLTTSTSSEATAQAMATVSLVKKEG